MAASSWISRHDCRSRDRFGPGDTNVGITPYCLVIKAACSSQVRQVLLPEIVSRSLLSLRGDAGANDPVFASRKGGGRLTQQGIHA